MLVVNKLPVNAGDLRDMGLIAGWGRSPGRGCSNPLHILAWRIPWTEEPGRLQSMRSHRVRYDWGDLAAAAAAAGYWTLLSVEHWLQALYWFYSFQRDRSHLLVPAALWLQWVLASLHSTHLPPADTVGFTPPFQFLGVLVISYPEEGRTSNRWLLAKKYIEFLSLIET